ncbi:hypothetical protein ACFB49_22080 [Sphingomonas sp. DBB INV C78]|uniref:hypothetical protein n=1 Tax=Sphingomonas sp. DBB INV C78 TaxID=3349434 RepID=UPI0036D3F7D9
MITLADLNHHLRREKEERARADAATDPAVRRSHVELAESHSRRAARARAILDGHQLPGAPVAEEGAPRRRLSLKTA